MITILIWTYTSTTKLLYVLKSLYSTVFIETLNHHYVVSYET